MSIELDAPNNYGAPADGLYVAVRGNDRGFNPRDVIDGYVLLDENDTPLGPVQVFSYEGLVVMNRMMIYKGERRVITVGVLIKKGIGDYAGKLFSVSITGVKTTASVTGIDTPITGGLKTLNSTRQVGRLTMGVGGAVVAQNIYPLVSQQPVMDLLFNAGSIEDQLLSLLVVDVRGEGGDMNDVTIGLHGPDGKMFVAHQVEASMLYGQGYSKIYNPIGKAKGALVGHSTISVQLGRSWQNGGTISFSVDPTKCTAVGGLNGYITVPLPRQILSGPVMTVTPVTTAIENAVQVDTGSQIPAGTTRLNLSAVAITAPADKDLVILSLGSWLGWKNGTLDKVNMYGFTDLALSKPMSGLQPDGAFGEASRDMDGYRQFNDIWIGVEDTSGRQSVLMIPKGETRYFVLRGDFTTSGAHSTLVAGIFDPESDPQETLTLQTMSR
ncbi:MAG: hypothetical protein Q7R93_05175 [bacterium]|nr:hypothetical protein [bacterium]